MHPKAKKLHPHTERVYVRVNSDFDTTGYMQPKSIIWNDGRVFNIDSIQDFRPVSAYGQFPLGSAKNDPDISPAPGFSGDCYTIVIQGEVRHLFFERTDPLFADRVGRWFVEQTVV